MFVGKDDKYQIVNDPGYWGAADPEFVVLGITKGETQSSAMRTAHLDGTFDNVAYKKFRGRLLEVLQSVGFMPGEKTIDPHLTAAEPKWGFASVLRCSLAAKSLNKKTGKTDYSGTSKGVIEGLKTDFHPWLFTCFAEHLLPLSPRTRIVFLYADGYPEVLKTALRKIWPDLEDWPDSEELAYTAGGRLFVHLGHPSDANGYLEEFLRGDASVGQGKKRTLANAAISSFRRREREMAG